LKHTEAGAPRGTCH